MWHELPFPSLLAILAAFTSMVLVSAAWLYLVVRRTRAARINIRALGASVEIDITKERRGEGSLSRRNPG